MNSNNSGFVHGPYINDNTYVPSTTTPQVPIQYVYPVHPVIPAVCPGCGRCNHCGRSAPSEFTITYGQTQS